MNKKKIALITMCASLALMLVLLTAVLVELSPIISLFFGNRKPSPQPTEPTVPATSETTRPTEPTTQPTTQPTEPTTQPTQPTQPVHQHEFLRTSTVAATCETSGYELYTCSGCGRVEMRNFTNALGHSYGPGEQINPTCTEGGYTSYTCTRCGKVEKRDLTEALDHDYVLVDEQEATCTQDGYKEYSCTRCDNVMRDDVVVAPGHAFSDWTITTEPSEGVEGVLSRECENCGETETKACELTLTRMQADDSGKRIHSVTVTAQNSRGEDVTVYAYTIWDSSFAESIAFTRGEDGELNVQYSDPAGAQRAYTIRAGDTLELDANGNIVTHTSPEPDPGSDPPEHPDPPEDPGETGGGNGDDPGTATE